MNPILFIHGFGGYIEQYQPIIKFLKKKGFENFYEFEYKNKFGFDSIKVITKELADFIEKNIKDEKIDVIAFSQGGIIALEFLKDFLPRQASKNIEVERLFTLCTPYKGSKLAKVANLPGIVELRPNSQLLKELEKFVKENNVNIYSVYTPFDLMVFPGWNAKSKYGKNKIVFAPTHPAVFTWPAVMRFIYRGIINKDKPITFKKNKIYLQKATEKDIPTLLSIEKKLVGIKTVSAITTEKEWLNEFNNKNETIYLIFRDGVVVGDTSYEKKPDGSVYLSGLVIDPQFHGQGIGRRTMEIIMEELKDVKIFKLVTHPENNIAIKLYQSFGFVIKSRIENYFGDNEPRIEMVKEK